MPSRCVLAVTIAGVAGLIGFAEPAGADVIVFDQNTNTGSQAVTYRITVDDNTAGLFTVNVAVAANSPANADIAALYFDFAVDDAEDGYRASDFDGAAITRVRFNTNNVQGGNIGERFQFGLAIGRTGSGHDFYDSFSFTMAVRHGLTLGDFLAFGVRGQSVGADASWGNPGSGSSKTFVGPSPDRPAVQPVPLPGAASMALAGLAAVGARRRVRR